MSKRAADLVVEAAGVRTCYGIAGDTLNRIADAIDRGQIDWVHVGGRGGLRVRGIRRSTST